jgi:hypothetical protein
VYNPLYKIIILTTVFYDYDKNEEVRETLKHHRTRNFVITRYSYGTEILDKLQWTGHVAWMRQTKMHAEIW